MNNLENPIERRTLFRGQNIAVMTAEQLLRATRSLTEEINQLEADDFKSSRVDKYLAQLKQARDLLIKTVDAGETTNGDS